jgi:dipeptidyl aminopeptidase/acylaminoacyl peptidase
MNQNECVRLAFRALINDPRVPKEEAVQVVDLLKKDGKIVDAHYYPNEGHGFEKREKPD